LIKSKKLLFLRASPRMHRWWPSPPFPSSPTQAPRWLRPPVSAAPGPMPAKRHPTCHYAVPPAPPPGTRPRPVPDHPPFSSLSASVQAVRAPFRQYRRVELPMEARLTTSPSPPRDQTGERRPPSTSSEHLAHADAVSHMDSNFPRRGEQCQHGGSLSIC
jgi:hypothetical protein